MTLFTYNNYIYNTYKLTKPCLQQVTPAFQYQYMSTLNPGLLWDIKPFSGFGRFGQNVGVLGDLQQFYSMLIYTYIVIDLPCVKTYTCNTIILFHTI